jgi:hypothetical protein
VSVAANSVADERLSAKRVEEEAARDEEFHSCGIPMSSKAKAVPRGYGISLVGVRLELRKGAKLTGAISGRKGSAGTLAVAKGLRKKTAHHPASV